MSFFIHKITVYHFEDDETVTKENLLNEATSLLHDIENDVAQQHKGVFQ